MDMPTRQPDRHWTCPVCGSVEAIPWQTITFIDATGLTEPLDHARACGICLARIKGEHIPLETRVRPRRKWHSNIFRLRAKPRYR